MRPRVELGSAVEPVLTVLQGSSNMLLRRWLLADVCMRAILVTARVLSKVPVYSKVLLYLCKNRCSDLLHAWDWSWAVYAEATVQECSEPCTTKSLVQHGSRGFGAHSFLGLVCNFIGHCQGLSSACHASGRAGSL